VKSFWKLTYNFFLLPAVYLVSWLLSIFNKKVRKGLSGRRQTLSILKDFFDGMSVDQLVYWFHSASHGEFEQIGPVLAGLKEIDPDCQCVVSFFSPSGYENVEDTNIDCKIYLPTDFYWNVRRALRIVHPHKLIFAEYDLWPNLVWVAEKMGIQTTLFSARIQKKSAKVWPILRGLYRQVYSSLGAVYTVSEQDHHSLRKLLTQNNRPFVRVLGNPRYDRVKEMADKSVNNHPKFISTRPFRFIAGSVWPEDDEIILDRTIDMMNEWDGLSVYWVPHEPSEKYVTRMKKTFDDSNIDVVVLSQCEEGNFRTRRSVIVDRVGILSDLYWQGRVAYVGGGFSPGVHNVMEPAIARLPTIFGPKFHNSDAAEALIKNGGGFSITTADEFQIALEKLLKDKGFLVEASLAATDVIHQNLGSATRVVRGIIRD
jgi:3-deoxy-D-manno-octulosonic-acid transferase